MEAGADIDMENDENRTALNVAITNSSIESIKHLLNRCTKKSQIRLNEVKDESIHNMITNHHFPIKRNNYEIQNKRIQNNMICLNWINKKNSNIFPSDIIGKIYQYLGEYKEDYLKKIDSWFYNKDKDAESQ